MKRLFKAICAALCFALVLAFASCGEQAGSLYNAGNQIATVTYGTYAQRVVSDKTTVDILDAMQLQNGQRATVGSTEYEAVVAKPYHDKAVFSDGTKIVKDKTYYFAVLPIEWYVLSSGEGESLLFAKDILDVTPFNTETEVDNEGVYPNDWNRSVLHSFLNDAESGFLAKAFDALAASSINYTKVISKYPQSFFKNHAAAIADSDDKVFALSYSETVNAAYGFSTNAADYDVLRMASPTDYAKAKGSYYFMAPNAEGNNAYFDGNGEYWLRTVGQDEKNAATVRYTGETGRVYQYLDSPTIGVRPAITVGVKLG